MKRMLPLSGLIISFLITSPAVAAENSAVIAQCKSIQNQIEHYSDLKRGGGNGRQMNQWHKQRNKYKSEFSKLKCYKYRAQLRD